MATTRWDQVFGTWSAALERERERAQQAEQYEKLREHQRGMQKTELDQGWAKFQQEMEFRKGQAAEDTRRFDLQEGRTAATHPYQLAALMLQNRGLASNLDFAEKANPLRLKGMELDNSGAALTQKIAGTEFGWRSKDRTRGENVLAATAGANAAMDAETAPAGYEEYNAARAKLQDPVEQAIFDQQTRPQKSILARSMRNWYSRPKEIVETQNLITGTTDRYNRNSLAGRVRQTESRILDWVPGFSTLQEVLAPTKIVRENTPEYNRFNAMYDRLMNTSDVDVEEARRKLLQTGDDEVIDRTVPMGGWH